MNLACSALLFDLDGVLIDSTPAVARVWTRWALERGFDPQVAIPVKVNGDSSGKANGVPEKANSRRSEATLAC